VLYCVKDKKNKLKKKAEKEGEKKLKKR